MDDFTARPIKLDFTSSEQGFRSATAIEAAGVRLFNALELIDYEDDVVGVQTEVCESCGITHCERGNWVVFRRMDRMIIWVPVWSEMDKGDWEAEEYRPPSFFKSRGAPVFSLDCWERLQQLNSALPRPQDLKQVNTREFARLCQWTAPGSLLGDFPAIPQVRRELFLAVTRGILDTEIDRVEQFIQTKFATPEPIQMLSLQSPVSPIEFWLNLPGSPAWKAFGSVDDQVSFLSLDGVAFV